MSHFRNYNGPQKSSPEHKGSSQRNYNSRGPYSPGLDYEDESHSKYLSERSRTKIHYERDMEDSEVIHPLTFFVLCINCVVSAVIHCI